MGATSAGRAEGVVHVTPDARAQSAAGVASLRGWLETAFGRGAELQLQPAVPYGDEELLAKTFAAGSDPDVEARGLLFALSATPEAVNHGLALAAVRDAALRAPSTAGLHVLVDEAGYAARMSDEPAWAGRLEERRRLWRDFVAGYGLQTTFVDLQADA